MEFWYKVIAQAISLVGAVIAFISFQKKENKKLFIFQSLSSLVFSISFFMLGAYTGFVLNIVNIFRGVLCAGGEKYHKKTFLLVVLSLYVATTIFTYENPYSIILLFAQILSMLSMWFGSGKKIRIIQLFCISPIWLIYNIMCVSIGAIICEIMNITSTVISLYRFRKTGFEDIIHS